MKKKITIYELLGLIKDGKAPKEIKYNDIEMEFNDNSYIYKNEDYGIAMWDLSKLNDYVEILDEEEFETIEELLIEYDDGDIGINKKYISSQQSEIFAKSINQLIKNQKKIIQKLNKEN